MGDEHVVDCGDTPAAIKHVPPLCRELAVHLLVVGEVGRRRALELVRGAHLVLGPRRDALAGFGADLQLVELRLALAGRASRAR